MIMVQVAEAASALFVEDSIVQSANQQLLQIWEDALLTC